MKKNHIYQSVLELCKSKFSKSYDQKWSCKDELSESALNRTGIDVPNQLVDE